MKIPSRPVPVRTRTNAQAPAVPARRRRSGVAVCTAGLAMAAAVVMSAPGALGTTPGAPEDPGAAAVVRALADDDPDAAALIPADFRSRFGYTAVVQEGLLVDPDGDCSSPVTLPGEFDAACKAHDLGYDMLRYADWQGAPLGPWARRAVDSALDRRMHAACERRGEDFSRARCSMMADIAFTAVDVNSRRQEYGPPVVENVFAETDATDPPNLWPLARTVLGLFAVTAASAVIVDAGRKRMRARRLTRLRLAQVL
ncbi:hypothetical protein ACFYTF_24655 [Nocardia thailandica]|uniref:Phospholipase n=1 Tax=Nocardia thailandica TaxID=257275 RepID=A0ABW6PUQ9_9NOCA